MTFTDEHWNKVRAHVVTNVRAHKSALEASAKAKAEQAALLAISLLSERDPVKIATDTAEHARLTTEGRSEAEESARFGTSADDMFVIIRQEWDTLTAEEALDTASAAAAAAAEAAEIVYLRARLEELEG